MSSPNPPTGYTKDFHVVLNHELDQVAARRKAVTGEERRDLPPDSLAVSVQELHGRMIAFRDSLDSQHRSQSLISHLYAIASGYFTGCGECDRLRDAERGTPIQDRITALTKQFRESAGELATLADDATAADWVQRTASACALGGPLLADAQEVVRAALGTATAAAHRDVPAARIAPGPDGGECPTCRRTACPLAPLAAAADAVIAAAAQWLFARRTAAARDRAKRMDLFGVSFSGGGIRSATFCLGVLQALGKLKLLRHVDYLSTVSGGGYIGGWLAAWVRREADGLAAEPLKSAVARAGTPPGRAAVENVERQLDPDRAAQARSLRRSSDDLDAPRSRFAEDREPGPIHHLRAHSRYLAPYSGLLSLDAWTLPAIVLRNFVVNMLLVLPLVALLVYGVRFAVRLFANESPVDASERSAVYVVFVAALLAAQFIIRYGLAPVRSDRFVPERQALWSHPKTAGYLLLVAGALAMWSYSPDHAAPDPTCPRSRIPEYFRVPHIEGEATPNATTGRLIPNWILGAGGFWDYAQGALLFAGLGAGFGLAAWGATAFDVQPVGSRWGGFHYAAFNSLFGALLGAGLTLVVNEFLYSDGQSRPALFATVGPPLFLLVLVVAAYVESAVAGAYYSEHEREWRSRLAAWMMLLAAVWLATFGAVAYLPQVFEGRSAAGTASVATVAGLAAVLRWLVPRLSKRPGLAVAVAVRVIPLAFLAALIGVAAAVADWAQPHDTACTPAERLLTGPWWLPLVVMAAFLLLATLFLLVIPVNRFSLHSMYANRLTRCYLGASLRDAAPASDGIPTAVKHPRLANTFTGFDTNDDLPLVSLRGGADGGPYPGPYPIFNATMNMVGGSELAYQDVLGESFALTPDHCGSDATGFARLCGPDSPTTAAGLPHPSSPAWHLTVGRAIAVSGAAIDPNMAVFQSPQFTAFLTILNARLGWWLANPNRATAGADWSGRPPLGSAHYLRELFGYTDARGRHVHLSDGGHFENTGAYELIRRRCRFVLLVDAAENPDNTSENLANLVRLVRADFGIRIEIDTVPLRRGADGLSAWHCAVGAIRYDDVDAGGVIGTLLFVRSSMTGDEPADIKNYASVTPVFPHHPTVDQFFDATQFESYRGLGYHIGMRVLQEAAEAEAEATVADADWHKVLEDGAKAAVRGALAPGFTVLAAAAAAAAADVRAMRRNPKPAAAEPPPAAVADRPPEDGVAAERAAAKELRPDRPPAAGRGRAAADPAAEDGEKAAAPNQARPHLQARFKRRLFGKLRRQWTPFSPAQRDQYIQSCVESLREGEKPAIGGDDRAVVRRIQLMELEWLRNDLAHNYSHPIQRGWVNVMRDWSADETFQRLWPRVRSEFSHDFVRFCERALTVGRPAVLLVPTAALDPALSGWAAKLSREFGREFHQYIASVLPALAGKPHTYLDEMVGKYNRYCWLIAYGSAGERDRIADPTDPPEVGHIVGLAAAFPPRLDATGVAGRKEFVLWIRGPSRMAGVGASVMRLLFAVGAAPLRGKSLFARLPRTGSGPAEQLQRAMWVQFMNDFDFYGVPPTGAEWEERELRVRYDPPPAPTRT